MQLIILGMHRSGTSALARLMNMMGAYFAAEGLSTGANEENPMGFWERRDVRALNDMLLHSTGCDWNRVANFDMANIPEPVLRDFHDRAGRIVLDMDAHRPWLLKEPRLCLLFPLWRGLLEVPYCIHIYRNPIEVASSLQKRNGMPIEVGCALWEKYNIEAFRASAGLPEILVSHNRLMKDPVSAAAELYDQLAGLGVRGLRRPAQQEITAFMRQDLYRERSTETDLRSFMNADQIELFRSIESERVLGGGKIPSFSEQGKLVLAAYEDALGPMEKPRKEKTDIEAPESALRAQLMRQERKMAQAMQDIRRLDDMVLQLICAVDKLARSLRWRPGRLLAAFRNLLLFKRAPAAPEDITRVKEGYELWKRSRVDGAVSENRVGHDGEKAGK